MLAGELEPLALRHVPGEGPLDIQPVSSGLVNQTYRVLRDGSAYALRVTVSNCSARGHGTWEARVLERASAANLAPLPVFCDPQRGLLISRWVEGRSWNLADVRLPENICRMADLVRRVHALPLPAPARLMSPEKWIDYYSAAAARSSGVDRTRRVAALLRTAAALRLTELARLPSVEPVLCHSDLHMLNLIDCGYSLVLLDWEYAHAADPFWDLAGWSANNDFGVDLRHDLLAAYTGRRPMPGEDLRLQLLSWLYDYVCLLWCDAYAPPGAAARAQELEARLAATASSRAD